MDATVRGRDPWSPSAKRTLRWVGDALALLLVASSYFLHGSEQQSPSASLVALIAIVAAALLLLIRRPWPVPVLVGCVTLYGLAAAAGTVAPGIVLAVAIATFNLANRSTRRATIIAAAITATAVFLLSVVGAVVSAADPRMVQFVLAVALAAAAGDATRSRREYIVAITERAERAEQTREAEARRRVSEERLKIARDLHDAVAHQIAVISLHAGVASSSLESPEQARAALSTIRSASRTVLGEIGDLLALLRAEDSDAAPTTPPRGLERLGELVEQFRQSGLAVRLRVEGDPGRVVGATDIVAYHVIQEGLTNAFKHGSDGRAHVLLEVTDDQVAVVITNPVLPFASGALSDGTTVGHGLVGLRERVASVRGIVETGIAAGGYRLAATLPLAKGSPG